MLMRSLFVRGGSTVRGFGKARRSMMARVFFLIGLGLAGLLPVTVSFAQTVSFFPQATFGAGPNPISVAIGDINRDGKLDLAIANSGDNSVSIFFGNGDGSFIPGGLFSGTGGTPESIAIGDLNRDGRPDLVVGMSDGGHISILFSDPDGGFDTNFTHVSVDGPTQPISVAIGDLNGDGSLDVATANRGSNNVSIL